MDGERFRRCGYEMVDFVADLMDTMRIRDPMPTCEPGYLLKLIPLKPPEKPETWDAIMSDIEPLILKGMTFWQHPHFHAYFPSGNSWSSVLGNILSNAFAGSSAAWEASPASTELEVIMLDWCAKFLGLPDSFYSSFSNPTSLGGGCIQTSASECVLLSLVASREHTIGKIRVDWKHRAELKASLIAYGSTESHSCFEKACIIANIKYRLLLPDSKGRIRANTLKKVIEEDIDRGYVPCFYNSVLGSTAACTFDDLLELGPICEEYEVWLHVDAAYAGTCFCCPEMRYLSMGLQYASSININANKWMNVAFDCSLYWVKSKTLLTTCLAGNDLFPIGEIIPEFRFWGIPTTRRFRALKLWFTIRMHGVKGLRERVRKDINLAKIFELHVRRDERFEVVVPVQVGLCCFRLKGEGTATENLNTNLLEALNSTHKMHLVPSSFLGQFVIRFAICSELTAEIDIDLAWAWILDFTEVLLRIQKRQCSKNNNVSKDLGEIFRLDDNYHKFRARSINPEVLSHLRNYYRRKLTGSIDFIAESSSRTGGSFASTADLKCAEQARCWCAWTPTNNDDSEQIQQIFSELEQGVVKPSRVVQDSLGVKHTVSADHFQCQEFKPTTG